MPIRNVKRLLLLSGGVCSGKSSVASCLMDTYGFNSISSGDYLRTLSAMHGDSGSRWALQELGDALDYETDYEWLISRVVLPSIQKNPMVAYWLMDAVRKKRQVELFRSTFQDIVWHIHLTAPEECLEARYRARASGEAADYTECVQHPNEREARSLCVIADTIFDTSILSPKEIAHTTYQLW